ncbi:peptidoglycan DD-metalloendopeptidase family protein [Marinibacterium profundimaris]|uniref:Peptidase M23B n=1 Tax=Marinibacterium profundimaris TaxID=1679460 RepID=A0A225NSH4_9RHOB|nr:peptidoglycan DD-metalloendopeptidase family protein [Marinibacterium profundimaris]OWU77871.1 peptidase M23B [Marinibacterium profundimaris]
MPRPAFKLPGTGLLLFGGLALLSACSEPLDMDLRGNLGGFSTAPAAQAATANRPSPDARGVITYPNYQVVVAQRGETVSSIAARLGFTADELGRFNGIDPNVALRDGEVVALPRPLPSLSGAPGSAAPGSVDIEALANAAIDASAETPAIEVVELEPAGPEPVRHKVERGETAYTVARLYGVSVQSLAEWNGLDADFDIREGQYLLIPVARSAPPSGVAAAAVEVEEVTEPGAGSPTPTPPSASQPLPENDTIIAAEVEAPDVTAEPQTIPAPAGAMSYPVQGKIIRAYAKGKNEGIDIAGSPGGSVGAAQSGTVAAITEDQDKVPIVVIRHSDNLLTVYANVTDIAVAKGQSVNRGQTIAKLRDGDASYVHFEVRDGFESVDPSSYLN